MNKYRIRFNKSRGQPGRGTIDHVWRVFEGNKEYLVKNVIFLAPAFSENEDNSEDWNMCCVGNLKLDKEKSIAIIEGETK